MESHPILIQQTTLEDEILSVLWWNSDSSQPLALNFTAVQEEDSQINTLLQSVFNNIGPIVAISASVVLLMWVLIRRRNRNSLILDDTEFEDSDGDEPADEDNTLNSADYGLEDYARPKPIVDSDYITKQVDETPILTENLPAEEKPTDRRAFTIDNDAEFVEKRDVKRRSGRINRNAQGPIMSTKRKRLDGKLDIPGERVITNKRPVTKQDQNAPSVRKVRKVRTVKKDD
ncbi:MAG TPA: hypothetical protein D7H81_04865 [Candidatus Poseidoniales archaeon]|nr:MAG TPA: hypothetical protein D7H81_04865 [Candidatus Poseidoniales archaeon]